MVLSLQADALFATTRTDRRTSTCWFPRQRNFARIAMTRKRFMHGKRIAA